MIGPPFGRKPRKYETTPPAANETDKNNCIAPAARSVAALDASGGSERTSVSARGGSNAMDAPQVGQMVALVSDPHLAQRMLDYRLELKKVARDLEVGGLAIVLRHDDDDEDKACEQQRDAT